jgi:hypothetical protein
MDEKISLKAVDHYSESYASAVASGFFNGKEKITGAEILHLCSIKQINLFILRELMQAWKIESQKLKSPFFDYQDEEVIEVMRQFQNVLSNHISIHRDDFLPLLTQAVSKTIYVLVDPYDFYSDSLDRAGKGYVQVADLKNDIKYLKINKPPLEKLVQKLEEKKLTLISGNEAFGLLDSILEEVNFTPEDIEDYLQEFSKVVPLDMTRLYEEKKTPSPRETPKPSPVVEPKKNTPSRSAVEHFQKVSRIKDSLTINQKFMFTKILFSGDFEIFSQAINRLDSLDNFSQAAQYLEDQYPAWDKESEEYLEFIELVNKRFA